MDNLREDTRERTWEDYVENAGAVLAAGAGIALFLHGGGHRQLNRFSKYIAGARRAYAEGAFRLDDLSAGFSRAKKIALEEFDHHPMADISTGRITETLYYGAQLSNKGKQADALAGQIRRSFQTEYGERLLDEMLSVPGHYVNDDAYDVLKKMLPSFAGGDPVSPAAIRAQLRQSLQEETPSDVIDNAAEFATNIQSKMQEFGEQLKNDLSGNPMEYTIGEFRGFNAAGEAQFDMGSIVRRQQRPNPVEQVEAIANASLNTRTALEIQEEIAQSPTEKALSFMLGERATAKEVAEAIEAGELDPAKTFATRLFRNKGAAEDQYVNTWEAFRSIRSLVDDAGKQDLDKIWVPNIRRGADGKLYSTAGIEDAMEFLGSGLANTLPGKMARLTEFMYNRHQPMAHYFEKGTLDYSLATSLGNMSEELRTNKAMMRLFGRFYEIDGTTLTESRALRDFTLTPGKVGASKDLQQGMRDALRAELQGRRGFFDGFFEGTRPGESLGLFIKPLDPLYGNQMDWMLRRIDPQLYAAEAKTAGEWSEAGSQVLNRIERFKRSMQRYGGLKSQLNVSDMERLHTALRQEPEIPGSVTNILQKAIDVLKDHTNESAIRYAAQPGSIDSPTNLINHQLSKLIADYKSKPQRTLQQTITYVDPTKKKSGSVHFKSLSFRENMAQEMVREAMLRAYGAKGTGIDGLERAFSRGSFRGEALDTLRSFTALSVLENQSRMHVYGETAENVASILLDTVDKARKQDTKEARFLFNALDDWARRYNFKGDAVGFDFSPRKLDRTGVWSVIHKSYEWKKQAQAAINIVANINRQNFHREIPRAARELVKPVTQYFSGHDVFQAGSSRSYWLYHVLDRVDDQLNREFNLFGHHINLHLGLNPQDKGSAYEILKNLTMKRVILAAVVYNYLDFADDATRAITGMGLGEAGMSGMANAYLGLKKITGATGLDYALKGVTSDSPFARYLADYTGDMDPEWNTYEEQKDYYERGYTPIRKARFWKFGSSNEYRGGKISYFEPNTLRMMRSNYYMESMYEGSMWTKWSHSLLPTPLNPLSPLNYLIDPYYLEELHKEDRPYPVTGSTFAENTPWGIVLNPFFDTFVKPRKQLYTDRLGPDGVDVRALIEHVNGEIRRKANNRQNSDIIYLQNGKLRSMLFTAFNAPTPSERIVGQQGANVTLSTEYGEYGAGIDAEEYPELATANADQLQVEAAPAAAVPADSMSVSDRLVISSAKGNVAATALVDTMKMTGVFDALRGANRQIREQGMLRKDQGFFYENKMRYEHSTVDEMLANSETISDLMTQGKGHDYIHEMAVSARMVSGLYGYMASLAFGMGQNNQKMIATSANMESAGRSFWDMSIGGFSGGPVGGDIMEIMRRFIPEFHRMQQVNPLMNNMPDWLPERMRFSDPYASLPKGEARLPGRGYESLNQLHPDIYGRYGAFDRFKILADVAPYSPEYKFWKKVAGATIRDPELKQEMQEIKDRVAEQTSGHDFYEYKYIGRGMNQQNAVVTEVMNFGKFKIAGSDQIYKLSGVKIAGNKQETTKDVLSRYLVPGQEITLFTDENMAYARNNDRDNTINAGVMIASENIAEQMLAAGDAKKRKGDTSATSYMLNHGPLVSAFNAAQEAIGHLNLPIFHSRFLKMESPLESYLDDNVYGTSFQNWNDLYGTFIRPALQIQASSPGWMTTSVLVDIIHNNIQNEGKAGVRNLIRETMEQTGLVSGRSLGAKWKNAASLAARFLDRGGLMGSLAGYTLTLGSSGGLSMTEQGRRLGSTAALAYAALANDESLAVQTVAWSRIGYRIANEVLKKNRLAMTAAGAAFGALRWASAQQLLSDNDLADTYIPDATKKKWDMQEYFDRLTYIKYMGLYEQAADMAKEKEGVDIRALLASQERERAELKKEKDRFHDDLKDLDRVHTADAEEAKKAIRKRLNSMHGVKLGLRGGEFTKSAIMYKNAADATIYGLSEDAVMADIVRALPKTERDYFIEFMKEKDAEKREEILRTVSPLLNRALRTIWKMPLPEKISNEDYFENHTLPAPTWAGWRPDIDLANVEAKVIYNQGMQFSDMGIYASQYREPAVQNAPNIEYDTSPNSMLLTRLKLQMALTGTGVDADSVSVEPSQDSGVQVIANVARIIPYKISEEFSRLF